MKSFLNAVKFCGESQKRILVMASLFIPVLCLAQVSANKNFRQHEIERSKACGGIDSVLALKGTWKKVEDDLAFPEKTFPRTQYKFVNNRIDSLFAFVKQSLPRLNGFEPRWQRGLRGDSYIPNGPIPYKFQSHYLYYICNTTHKKIVLGDETSTWAYVFVNRLNWFLYEADTLDINDEGKVRTVFQLPASVGKWKGSTVYELKGTFTRSARSVIIGRNGKVPWRSLSRKQYLTGLKNKWENELKRFPAGSGYEKDYKEKIKHIHDYLAIADEESLQQPAIIDPNSGIWGFKGKFGEEGAGGFKLVLSGLGEKYFDKGLPRYVPQLIQLYWSYGQSAAEQFFKEQFEENFPLEKLKAMIDK